MAYTALNLGYTPQAGYEYTGITDSSLDWGSVPNNTYFYDLADKLVHYKNGSGSIIEAFSEVVFTPTINSKVMKEVSVEADFGTAVGGVITLAANTTYFIRGEVTCTSLLSITNNGTSIRGWDRDVAILKYTGAAGLGSFIEVHDVSTEIIGICISTTNATPGDVAIHAHDFDYTQTTPGTYDNFNAGRDKVLTIINCQFRNCFDVHHIEGFDLVDIQNCLFWYIGATAMGCHFKNISKLQISSCEYVRWFDETSLPTPSGYATTPMIELRANGVNGPGFGAVNITGSIIHPQQTQNGLRIQPGSTTGFGTITGNTFVKTGLTPNSHVATITLTGTSGTANILIGGYQNYLTTFDTDLTTTAANFVTDYAQELQFRYGINCTSALGVITFTSFIPGTVFYITSIRNVSGDLDGTLVHGTPIHGVRADLEYDSQNDFIVQGNQGLRNGFAKGGIVIQDNAQANAFTAPTSYQVLNATNVGGAFTNSPYFPQGTKIITDRDACSITYNQKDPGSFLVAVNATVGGTAGFVTCRLRFTRGGVTTSLPFATGTVEVKNENVNLSFTTLGEAEFGDIFDVEFITTGTTLTVTDFTLNGHQF